MTLSGTPRSATAWYGWRGSDSSTSSTRRRSNTIGDVSEPETTTNVAQPEWQRNPIARPFVTTPTLRPQRRRPPPPHPPELALGCRPPGEQVPVCVGAADQGHAHR